MRLLKLTLILFNLSVISFAQQPDIAHLIPVPLEINPAYAGSYYDFKGGLFFRGQWLEYEDAPKMLSFHTDVFIDKLNSGLGVMFTGEQNGPLKNRVGRIAYSYKLKFNKLNLSFGLGAKYLNSKFISSWTTPSDEYYFYYNTDDLYLNALSLSTGVFLYRDKLYGSISYTNKIIYTNETELSGSGTDQINIVAGYHFFKGNNFSFCPSVYYRHIDQVSNYMKLNLKTMILNMVWISLSFDTLEYIEIAAGADIWKVYFGGREIRPTYNNNFGSEIVELFTGFYFN